MEILGMISFTIIASVVSFVLGITGMARYKSSSKSVEKPATRDTLYADRVINTAAMIYCNYNESKIIRPRQQVQQKKDRYGEALQEALNLVGAAYKYFDIVDGDSKNGIEIN